MKLISLSIKNVNGITDIVPLSGKDLFLGPNGSGKSTRIKAVRIARLGKDPDPRVGAQPISLRKLASGEDMAISLTAQEGDRTFSITRTYRERDGSASQKVRIEPAKGEKTVAAMEKRIREELGDFDLMFDDSVFDGLSGNGKRDFIFQLCQGASGLSAAEIMEKIVPPEPLTDPADLAFFDSWKKRIAREWRSDKSFLENFNDSLSMVKAAISEMRGKEAGAEEAARRLTELKNEHPEIGNLNLSEIDREISDKEGKVSGLTSEISTSRERVRAISEIEATVERITREIKSLPEFTAEDGKALEKAEADYRDGQGREAELRAKIATLSGSSFTPEDNWRLGEIDGEIGKARETIAGNEKRIADLSARIFTSEDKAKLDGIEVALRESREERAVICANISNLGSCPVGIADCSHLQKAQGKIEEAKKQLAGINTRIDSVAESAMALQVKRDESPALSDAIAKIKVEIGSLASEIGSLEREKKDLAERKAASEKSSAELSAAQAELAPLAARLARITEEGKSLREKSRQAERRAFLEGQLQTEQKRLTGIGNVADVEGLEQQRAVLSGQIATLKTERKAKAESKLQWEQAERAALDQVRISSELAILRSLERLLGPRGIQGEIVRSIMGPLSEKVQSLMVDPSLRFDCRMQDEKGKEIFELGFSRDGQFISVPSGGESILFRAAFLTALTMQANPRNKTMLLELAECDRENAEILLERLGDYVDKGLLDNVLVAYCHEIATPEGWTTHLFPGRRSEETAGGAAPELSEKKAGEEKEAAMV